VVREKRASGTAGRDRAFPRAATGGQHRAGTRPMSRRSLVLAAVLSGSLIPGTALGQEPPAQLDSTYGCLACHADKRAAFNQGVHAERGIKCVDCHGGDPRATALPAAHRGNFSGPVSKVATVTLCGSCHSDPNMMRPFGLRSGEVAEFRTSRHGILLLRQRNDDAPTCTDCHDAHTILRPDDARSNVHPTNIVHTCARCRRSR